MAQKDDPARRVLANYPSHISLRTVFSDMDVFRHLNNGAIGRYLEEGRANLNMGVFGVSSINAPAEGAQILFVSILIDYLAQAYYPGEVQVGTAVLRVGSSSCTVAQAAFQNETCFALAEVVMVKALDGRGTPLSDGERGGLQTLQLRHQS